MFKKICSKIGFATIKKTIIDTSNFSLLNSLQGPLFDLLIERKKKFN